MRALQKAPVLNCDFTNLLLRENVDGDEFMKIKVSVLVPICNVEKFLDKCLQSITSQTLKEIEIICINDGSKDKSLDIIKKYAMVDDRIVIVDKENTGYGDSMNLGLRIARGEYVGIVESDDFISQDMFEDLYNLAVLYKADIVKSNFYMYWEKPEKIKVYDNLKIKGLESNIDLCRERLFVGAPAIWSAIYRNVWLKKENIDFLPTPGASYQDTSFKFKTTAIAEKIVLSPKSYLYYRQDNVNSSVKSATKEKVLSLHKEYEEIERFINKHNLFRFNKFYCSAYFSGCMWNYARINDDDFKGEYLKLIHRIFEKEELEICRQLLPNSLKYGGYYAFKNNNKLLLDLVILLQKIKSRLAN